MRNFKITVDGTPYQVSVEELDVAAPADSDEQPSVSAATHRPVAPPAATAPTPAAANAAGQPGDVISPLAGTVIAIEVTVGQQVSEGQQLVVLEAMKMHTYITASQAGRVSAIKVLTGTSVSEGQVLLSIA